MSVRLWGQDQAVNTTTDGEQGSPSIARLTNGDLVVVWEDLSAEAGQIRARIYAPDGTARGPEFDIAATAAAELDPMVVALSDGGFHVTFEQGTGLKTLTFTADGTPDGSSQNYGNSGDVAAVGRGGGSGEAMVQAYEFGNDIWVTTYDTNGNVIADKKVNTTGVGLAPQSDPDVAILNSFGAKGGQSIVVWQEGDGAGSAIYGRFVTSAGEPAGAADFKISQASNTAITSAKVTALQSGFVVMWTEADSTVSDSTPDIFARMYNADGVAMAGSFQVNTGSADHQKYGDVVGLPDGGFIAIWQQDNLLEGQRFDAYGERIGTEFRVGSTYGTADDVRGISATLMADGRVAVTWESSSGDGANGGVRLQILDPRDGQVVGTDDVDTLYGSHSDDQVIAEIGADVVYAGGGHDQVFGGGGDDTLRGEAGDDSIYGQQGWDTLDGGFGFDRLDGGSEADTVDYSARTQAVVLTLKGAAESVAKVGGVAEDIVLNIENILGGKAGDILTGDDAVNYLVGNEGNDVLKGGGGSDILNGGAGIDTADYRGEVFDVTVDLGAAVSDVVALYAASNDTLIDIERVFGGEGWDILTGDAKANTLMGYGGDDFLKGGAGKDLLVGGLGSDTADFSDKTSAVSVTLNGNINVSVKVGGVVQDTIRGIESIHGGSAADTLTGDGATNLFRGNGGVDVIDGKGGSDYVDFSDKTDAVILTLNGATQVTANVGGVAEDKVKNVEGIFGGQGSDTLTGDGLKNTLFGGNGADTLKGRGGADTLSGGKDADTFVFSFLTDSTPGEVGRDTIKDFSGTGFIAADVDKIDLSGIDAVSGGANNAFTFGEMTAGQAGRLEVTVLEAIPEAPEMMLMSEPGYGKFLVEGDVTGDGVADFAIIVYSETNLNAGDFVL